MARRGFVIDHRRHVDKAAWVACAVLGLLVSWLLARLAWQLLPHDDASATHARAQRAGAAATAAPARSIASWHLFGETPRRPGADAGGEAASTLSLILRGTVADSDPKAGFAVIGGSDGNERTFRVGEEVVPGVRLAAVHPDRVVLSRGGSEETLRLPRDRNLAPTDIVRPAPATSRSPRAGSAVAARAASTPSAAQTVKLPAEAQQTLARLRQNPDELMKRVQIAPVLDGGRLTGVRVAAGADAALLGQFGLRPGDVVTAVNGQAVDSFVRGQQILAGLANASSARVTVLRDGKPVELSVGLQ